MDEFFEHYGVKNQHELTEKVKSDSLFAIRVVEDLLAEKFPPVVPEPEVVVTEEHHE